MNPSASDCLILPYDLIFGIMRASYWEGYDAT